MACSGRSASPSPYYALGSSVPNVDRYLLPLVALVVLVSLAPLAVELLRSRRRPHPAPDPTPPPGA